MAVTKPRPKPRQYSTPSGDFLAFVEDVKRKDTRAITLGEKTFHLRGPALLSDEEIEAVNSDKSDVISKARAVIDDYDAFAAAGGTAMLLMTYYDQVFKADAAGESEASSAS